MTQVDREETIHGGPEQKLPDRDVEKEDEGRESEEVLGCFKSVGPVAPQHEK